MGDGSPAQIPYKNIFVACDHAGLDLKRQLMTRFPNWPWKDLGTHSVDSVDYPDFADQVCQQLKNHTQDSCGLLICGSGQGMAIRANRFSFIRAALCWAADLAKLSRQHNDANVLCLGSRVQTLDSAANIVEAFLRTPFEGGRHQRRVSKLSKPSN